MIPMLNEQAQIGASAKTAVYLRYWKDKDAEAPDHQELEVRRYCAARGWTDLQIYMDRATGGKASRPALDRMMRNLRTGKVARVVCHSFDALGRSLTHLCLLVEELTRLQVPLVCVSHGFDTMYEPCVKVLAAVCHFRRSLYNERVNAGLTAARAKGVCLGRPETLPCRRDDVLELRQQGKGIRKIARELRMPVTSVFKLVKVKAS